MSSASAGDSLFMGTSSKRNRKERKGKESSKERKKKRKRKRRLLLLLQQQPHTRFLLTHFIPPLYVSSFRTSESELA